MVITSRNGDLASFNISQLVNAPILVKQKRTLKND